MTAFDSFLARLENFDLSQGIAHYGGVAKEMINPEIEHQVGDDFRLSISKLFPSTEASPPPVSRIEFVFDTNVLLKMATEQPLKVKFDSLKTWAPESDESSSEKPQVGFILPGQAYVEFFNNYKRLEDNAKGELNKALQKIEMGLDSPAFETAVTLGIVDSGALEDLRSKFNSISILKGASEKLSATTLSDFFEFLGKDINASVVSAPRRRLASLGRARTAGKIPPAWKDEKIKGEAGLGDFYLWVDMLFSLFKIRENEDSSANRSNKLAAAPSNSHRLIAVFVSNDTKPDWGSKHFLHPYLALECRDITGFEIYRMPLDQAASLAESIGGLSNALPNDF